MRVSVSSWNTHQKSYPPVYQLKSSVGSANTISEPHDDPEPPGGLSEGMRMLSGKGEDLVESPVYQICQASRKLEEQWLDFCEIAMYVMWQENTMYFKT